MQKRRIYCLVPIELAGRLHEALRSHFQDRPEVEVIVERRRRGRRSDEERREGEGPVPGAERRRIRNASGRRVAERRAPLVPIGGADAPELPRRVRRFADRIVFVERVEPATEAAEDAATARLVTRIQAGERELFSDLYLRYFDRVYSYVRVVVRDQHEAEDLGQQVFMRALEAIGRYERRSQPFRVWLFVIARNCALAHLRRSGRLSTEGLEVTGGREARAPQTPAETAETMISWVSDGDLMVLIERLPEAQRQALSLRFMLGLSNTEIAKVLDRSEGSVRMLHSRALGFLRQRLTAMGRAPHDAGRARMWRWPKQARVLRARRFSLLAPGPHR